MICLLVAAKLESKFFLKAFKFDCLDKLTAFLFDKTRQCISF